MKEPTFDKDGYPTEETERAIAVWNADDEYGLIEFVQKALSSRGNAWLKDGEFRIVTGGWSGNEQIVSALRKSVFWAMYWISSHRGGLHVFNLYHFTDNEE